MNVRARDHQGNPERCYGQGVRVQWSVGRVACHAKWSSVGRARYLVSLPVLVRVSCDPDSNSILVYQHRIARRGL